MVREARQGREEAHRIRTEAFLIKKGAGTCLFYSRVYLLPHKKGCRHVLNLFQGFCFSLIKKGAGHVINLFQGFLFSLVKKDVYRHVLNLFQGFCSP
jgi:hypothetical protein